MVVREFFQNMFASLFGSVKNIFRYVFSKEHCEERKLIRKEWYLDGQRHRVDGPAIENINGKYWYMNGQLHRVDYSDQKRKIQTPIK